jgi:hypothetical protein
MATQNSSAVLWDRIFVCLCVSLDATKKLLISTMIPFPVMTTRSLLLRPMSYVRFVLVDSKRVRFWPSLDHALAAVPIDFIYIVRLTCSVTMFMSVQYVSNRSEMSYLYGDSHLTKKRECFEMYTPIPKRCFLSVIYLSGSTCHVPLSFCLLSVYLG